jgi:hypothetical protein
MYITPGMLLLGFLVYLWFSQPPSPNFDCGGPCCARRNGRALPHAAPATGAPALPNRSGHKERLWIAAGLLAFVVLSLLTHALVPR